MPSRVVDRQVWYQPLGMIWSKLDSRRPSGLPLQLSGTQVSGRRSISCHQSDGRRQTANPETYRLIEPGMVDSTGPCCEFSFDRFPLLRTQPRQLHQASFRRSKGVRACRASISGSMYGWLMRQHLSLGRLSYVRDSRFGSSSQVRCSNSKPVVSCEAVHKFVLVDGDAFDNVY
jgi:hypothetical protein